MRCALCSHEFNEDSAKRSCSACFKIGKCEMIKCPKCGYEIPPEPEWIKKVKRLFHRGRRDGDL
ncbi:hypothetical protein ACFL0T_04230 [Candidatus Omnitrophota bacterium]